MPDPKPGAQPPKQAAPKKQPKMKVVAIADGYYDNKLRRVGDVFFIDGRLPALHEMRRGDGTQRDPNVPIMLGKWMRPAPADAQPHTTSSNEVIRRENQETREQRATGATPEEDPAASDEDDPLGAGKS